jgi:2-deoxy-D-gluconate 3-dehydrogenase
VTTAGALEPARNPLLDLSGRVALVTGGASGIGAAAARMLSGHGAQVLLGHRAGPSREAARELARELDGHPVEFDVRDVEATRRAVADIARRAGSIDMLVNSAGTNIQQSALDVDEAVWDAVVDTNLKGVFFCTQAVVRTMSEHAQDGGPSRAVVSVASQMGLVGYARRAAYCASKAGVVNLTRVLAIEWASRGIRVNAVAPGFVETPLSAPMLADDAFRAEILERIPMRRTGTVDEVAAAILYLCSPASEWVTGHTLSIDGGWTAW